MEMLKSGDKAYFDAYMFGCIPCKVLSITRDNYTPSIIHAEVKLTASRGEFNTYKRGGAITTTATWVYPRKSVHYRSGIAHVWKYGIKVDAE